jgi:molybdenum cofactor cytidylyltransferase
VTAGTLILAAGRSRRMGRPKALLPYRGRTFLEHLVTLYSVFGPVWVAVNSEVAPEVQLLGIPAPVFVVENPAPGLFSTVRPCVARLRCRTTRLFVTPVDCILPDGRVPAALLDAEPGDATSLAPVTGGRRGHPVLLLATAIAGVAEESNVARFDRVLEDLGVADIPVDEPRIHLNINTPDDYTRFLASEVAQKELT